MKAIAIGIMCMAAACTNEHNVGDTYSLQSARWAVGLPVLTTPGVIGASYVAVDPHGDVLAGGSLLGAAEFGATTVTSPASDRYVFWISKRSGADGTELWTRVLGGSPNANFDLAGIATDPVGDVIAAGDFSQSQSFGDMWVRFSGQDVFATKIDPDGHTVWVQELPRGTSSQGFDCQTSSVAVGGDGRIYVSGRFQGVIEFPNGTVSSVADAPSYFVAAFESDGTLRWGRELPIAGHLAVAHDGSVIMVGAVEQPTTFSGVQLDPATDGDRFVASISADGEVAWVRTFSEPSAPFGGMRLALDDQDRVATISLSTSASSSSETGEAMLDPGGHVLWTASHVSGQLQEEAIATNGHAVLTAGRVPGGSADLGAGMQSGSMYLAARDDHGSLVDSKLYGSPSRGDAFTSLAMSRDGALAFTGAVTESIDFGSGPVPGPLVSGDGTLAVLGVFAPPP